MGLKCQLESEKNIKSKWLDFTHFLTNCYFSHMQMKSRPKKNTQNDFLSVEQFIVKTQFEIS